MLHDIFEIAWTEKQRQTQPLKIDGVEVGPQIDFLTFQSEFRTKTEAVSHYGIK